MKTPPTPGFDPDTFRRLGHELVELLASHLENVDQLTVSPNADPINLLTSLSLPNITTDNPSALFKMILDYSQRLHHPRYFGPQVTTPLPLAALGDFIASFLNNAHTAEMGPIHVAMEHVVIEWMKSKVGYHNEAAGFFTSGGSLGNLTALLAARQTMSSQDPWQNGVKDQPTLGYLMSDQAHYSNRRALQIMGLGSKAAITVKTDQNYKMDITALNQAYQNAKQQNITPICVIASACNTGPGTFDPIEPLAEFCKQHQLWLHVDAAHGASALLSPEHRLLLRGIESADSIVWDCHKLLMMPSLATAVLFKNKLHASESLKFDASYLAKNLEGPTFDWKNPIKHTIECTKNSMALKMYICLRCYGEEFFAQHVNSRFALAKQFAHLLKERDFEVPVTPESNIVCFRYIGNKKTAILNTLQKRLRSALMQEGRFCISETYLGDKAYLRVSLMNPKTTLSDLNDLLTSIEYLAQQLIKTIETSSCQK